MSIINTSDFNGIILFDAIFLKNCSTQFVVQNWSVCERFWVFSEISDLTLHVEFFVILVIMYF